MHPSVPQGHFPIVLLHVNPLHRPALPPSPWSLPMHPISFQSVLQTTPTQGSLAWAPMKQQSTYLYGDLGGKGPRLSQSDHPALHPQGHSQNQAAAKPRAATAQMLRLLWTQKDGFYRRPSPRQCRIPMDLGWGPGSLTEYSRNQPGQFAELQGRKE